MRGYLLQQQVGTIVEQPVDAAQLATADEVFLTNAIRGVRWVATVGDTRYTCGIAMQMASVVAQIKPQ